MQGEGINPTEIMNKNIPLIILACMLGGCAAEVETSQQTDVNLAVVSDAVHFPQEKLEKTIRVHLGKADGVITKQDLLSLDVLRCYGVGVYDLRPIAYMTRLKRLELTGNSIVNLSPLAGLTNLQTLNLVNNSIIDVSPLAGLTNLRELDLRNNKISSLLYTYIILSI